MYIVYCIRKTLPKLLRFRIDLSKV